MTTATPHSTTTIVEASRTLALGASGLLAGATLAMWLLDVELGRSASLFTEYRQAVTGPLTSTLPPLGAAALLAAIAAGALRRGRGRVLALSAAACMVAGLAVTVIVHFPINDAIMTWSAAAPPANWEQLRDRWQAAHAVRSVLAVVAFGLLTVAGRPRPTASSRPG